MALQLIRLNEYTAGQFIYAAQWNAEFDQLVARISDNPALNPLPLSFFSAAPSSSTVFPQWICPANTTIVIGSFMYHYFSGSGSNYKVRFYKNSIDLGIEVKIGSLNSGKDKEFKLSQSILLEAGDILQVYLTAGSGHVNATLQCCGLMKWFIPAASALADPPVRFTEFKPRQIIEAADLEGEVENIKDYWDVMTHCYTHAVQFAGAPTTASRGAIFVVPGGWDSATFVKGHIVFHSGTASDSTVIGVYYNGVLLDSLTLNAASVADTDYPVTFSQSLTAVDVLEFRVTDDSGAHQNITVQLDIEFRIRGTYNRIVPLFDGVIESGQFESELDGLNGFYNIQPVTQVHAAYFEDPTSTSQRTNTFMTPANFRGGVLVKLYMYFTGGSATGQTSFDIQINNDSFATLTANGAGDPIDTLITTGALTQALEAGDKIKIIPTTVTGSQQRVSVLLEVECELI